MIPVAASLASVVGRGALMSAIGALGFGAGGALYGAALPVGYAAGSYEAAPAAARADARKYLYYELEEAMIDYLVGNFRNSIGLSYTGLNDYE